VSLTVAVPKESGDGELRVALDPSVVQRLRLRQGVEVRLQAGCGRGAGFYDDDYEDVSIADSFADTVSGAAVVVKVTSPTAEEAEQLPFGSILICIMSAFQHLDVIDVLLRRRITTLAMDFLPRITRAQPMDALSSQATVTGYKAALLAAELSPRLFPMLTTAAGTIRPSRVIVIGAGVAGLQAIATARRLGAQVEAYDIRRAAKEQIESLGARMIDTGVEAEGSGGYARGLTKDEKQKQHDVLAERMSHAHAVICAAAIPGRHAPSIITEDMVEGMLPDTVIVDTAADTGGNCELTRPGESYMHGDTLIVGPINMPSSGAVHASEMYARNLLSMLRLILQDGQLQLDWQDEIVSGCLLTHAGGIHHAPTAELLGVTLAAPMAEALDKTVEIPNQAAGWIAEDESGPATSAGPAVSEPKDDNDSAALVSKSVDSGSVESNAAIAPGKPLNTTNATQETAAEQFAQPDTTTTDLDSSDATRNAADDEPPPDELTLINGVGPALQSQLYAFGFTRFTHLAELDADGVQTLEQQLELDGHIERDDWCGQAAELARSRRNQST